MFLFHSSKIEEPILIFKPGIYYVCMTYYVLHIMCVCVCVCFCVFNENSKILNVIWILNDLSDQQCGEATQETLVKKFLLFFFFFYMIKFKQNIYT